MKDKFLINFYRDGVIVSQQRFLGGRPGAERLAQHIAEMMSVRGISVSYEIIKQ